MRSVLHQLRRVVNHPAYGMACGAAIAVTAAWDLADHRHSRAGVAWYGWLACYGLILLLSGTRKLRKSRKLRSRGGA